jgi:hypothetical protein
MSNTTSTGFCHDDHNREGKKERLGGHGSHYCNDGKRCSKYNILLYLFLLGNIANILINKDISE